MSQEIERKFLLKDSSWRYYSNPTDYRQGYLSTKRERVVRVRTIGDRGFLTVKGEVVGLSRVEYEYEIPYLDATMMLDNLCEKPLVEKRRSKISFEGFIWEVDEFFGVNAGLVIAEVELKDELQHLPIPYWVGEEVSDDPRYFNSNLVKHPYTTWN